MHDKKKYEKPIEVNMGFDEMMQRLSKVSKSTVDKKFKHKNKGK